MEDLTTGTSRHSTPHSRTLEALGLADAPRDQPLLYPGAWPADSGLLDGDQLLPLDRLVHDGLLAVELGVLLAEQSGPALGLSLGFCALLVSMVFVWRSFYRMRIGSDS